MGDQGKPGEDGKSAYELWLEAGNEGSLEDFFEAFRGTAGQQGLQGIPGAKGDTGEAGEDGEDGVGIELIAKTAGTGEYGTSDTYTIYFTNGNTFEFYVTNGTVGIQGPQGEKGETGAQGEPGVDGTSVVILGSVNDESEIPEESKVIGNGYLIGQNLFVWDGSIWKDVGEIKGPKGDRGEDGVDGRDGRDGIDAPIPEFKINDNGHLVCILNGVAQDLGAVVGQDGTNSETEYKIPSFQIEDGHL